MDKHVVKAGMCGIYTIGIGGWQTVSVKTVDEAEEKKDYEKALEDQLKEQHEVCLIFEKQLRPILIRAIFL